MNVLLINPPLVGIKNDIYGGIPFIPAGITYIASYLQSKGHKVDIADLYGEDPQAIHTFNGKYLIHGLNPEVLKHDFSLRKYDVVGISIHSVAGHSIGKRIIDIIKVEVPSLPVMVGGSHPTIAYKEFLDTGADFVILGEGEETTLDVLNVIQGRKRIEELDGIAYKDGIITKSKFIKNLDELPFPAVDLIKLENYWNLFYSHGPVTGKYLFIISSRGCPYNCSFCTTPNVWQRSWRYRSAKNVVDEIAARVKRYNVTDFHFQDDGFATNKKRVLEICKELINRKLNIRWKLPAGVKAETLDEETLLWMKKSGFNYISVSPETGSKRVAKLMNKPVDYSHFETVLKTCIKNNITTQACFILGFPGEEEVDIRETRNLIKLYARLGVDEIAIYIMTPLPGASVFEAFNYKEDYECLSFSPVWRIDYGQLSFIRKKLYFTYFFYKIIFHPFKIMRHVKNVFSGRFETKMEMTLYRIFKVYMNRF